MSGAGASACVLAVACGSGDDNAASADGGPDATSDAGSNDGGSTGDAEAGTGDPNFSHSFSAGSRLRPIWLESEGGIKQLLGFRDTKLGTDCIFGQAEDDSLRCLPAGIALHQTGRADFGESPPYLDDTCTKPFTNDTACTAAYAAGFPGDAGCLLHVRMRVRSLSAGPIDASAGVTYYRVASDGGCGDAGVTAGTFLPLGAVLLPSELVAAHRENGAAIGAIAPRYVVADDGTRYFDGFVETATNAPCSFSVAQDGVARCLPTEIFTGQEPIFFADDKCTVTAIPGDANCATPTYGSLSDKSGCGSGQRYVKVGALISSSYSGPGGATNCTANPPGESALYTTTPVAITSFTAASGMHHAGGPRLKEVVADLPGGATVTMSLFDETRNEACNFGGIGQLAASDGSLRCLPRSDYYELDNISPSADCDGGVAVGNGCVPDAGPHYAFSLQSGCPSRQPVRAIVEAPLTNVWTRSASSCTGPGSANPSERATAAELPPSTFVEGKVMVAP